MGYDSGNTTVTGNVSTTMTGTLPSNSTTQTLVKATLIDQNSGSTLYTASAGKTFYCLGIMTGSATGSQTYLVVNGVSGFKWSSGASGTGGNLACSGNGVLFTLAATQSVTVTTNVASQATVTIWGYEV